MESVVPKALRRNHTTPNNCD